MPKLTIQNFGGETPRTGDTELSDSGASLAENVRLYSGELRTWGGPRLEYDPVNASLKTLYRFKNYATSATKWLTWQTDVDVQRSSLDDTTDFRLYYTGDGIPKKTNWSMATSGGGPYPTTNYNLGVPAPITGPTATAAAGASPLAETRSYIYTYVSTFGTLTEESAPSPPTQVTITAAQSVNVAGFATTPVTGLNITARRIYRTQPGENTNGAFVFVAEIAIATTTYNDNKLVAALGAAITTTTWDEPLAGLKGLTSMANGMMAGFIGNTVYFCEPYFHHAWPSEYAQSIPDQIVGLGSYGNTLVVMTQAQPYAMIGVNPSQMSVEKISMPEPCISKRSIAFDQYGVLYASPNGIVGIGPGVRKVISNELFRRNEWQEYAPETIIATIYDGKYFATFASTVQGNKTMVVSRDDYPALAFLTFVGAGFFSDQQEGQLYYINTLDDVIYQLDSDQINVYQYQWISKRFVLPQGISWSCLRLDIDEVEIDNNSTYAALIAAIAASNALITGPTFGLFNEAPFNHYAVNGSNLTEVPPPGASVSANVILIGEKGEVKSSTTVERYGYYRIAPFRSREITIKLTGNLRIRSVSIATSLEELRGGS